MKPFKNLLLLVLMLFVSTAMFAIAQEVPDVTDPSQLVSLLTIPVTWLAVELVKKIKLLISNTGIASGWILGLFVPAFSALSSWILTLLVPDANFVLALVVGLASTFVDQLIKKFNEG